MAFKEPQNPGSRPDIKRIGVISDTHGLIRPEALAALQGSELIIHAGDIGSLHVLDSLCAIAPVVAVRGNMDGGWAETLPETEVVEAGEFLIYIIHDLAKLDLDPASAGFNAVVCGHSHRPSLERVNGVLFHNPGSAGPKRFELQPSMAIIDVNDGNLEPLLIELKTGVLRQTG
jgi:putative phosphoesterase